MCDMSIDPLSILDRVKYEETGYCQRCMDMHESYDFGDQGTTSINYEECLYKILDAVDDMDAFMHGVAMSEQDKKEILTVYNNRRA